MSEIKIMGMKGIPEIKPGDNLGEIIVSAIRRMKIELGEGDIIVVTSKIVSKAEGRLIDLNQVKPSKISLRLGKRWKKDPRVVEMILSQAKRIVRMDRGILIVETSHGFICANAGIDQSNIGENYVALLPVNPDRSAKRIREVIRLALKADVSVIISDTFGRPWRQGQVDVAIGVSGLKPVMDYRGISDSFGHKLRVTMIAVADEIASASELAMGKLNQVPIVVIKGYPHPKGEGSFRELLRNPSEDLFR